jgi:hypothetical protein
LYFNISMCSMPYHCVNTRSLTRIFKKGLKIGARIMKQHSPQRKINKPPSTGSVKLISMVVNFLVVLPPPCIAKIS